MFNVFSHKWWANKQINKQHNMPFARISISFMSAWTCLCHNYHVSYKQQIYDSIDEPRTRISEIIRVILLYLSPKNYVTSMRGSDGPYWENQHKHLVIRTQENLPKIETKDTNQTLIAKLQNSIPNLPRRTVTDAYQARACAYLKKTGAATPRKL